MQSLPDGGWVFFSPLGSALIWIMSNSKCILWPFPSCTSTGWTGEIGAVAPCQVEVCKMRHAPHTPDTSYSPSMSSGVWNSRIWLFGNVLFHGVLRDFMETLGNRNCWNGATKDVSTPSGSWVISCDAYTRREVLLANSSIIYFCLGNPGNDRGCLKII